MTRETQLLLLGRKEIISKLARTCLVLPTPDEQEHILLQVDPVEMKKELEDKLPKNEPSTTDIAPKPYAPGSRWTHSKSLTACSVSRRAGHCVRR